MEKHSMQEFIVHTLVKQALTFEEQTIEFYHQAAAHVAMESNKQLLLSFAEEEQNHKQQLELFLSGDFHEIYEVHLSQEKLNLAINSYSLHRKIDDTWSAKAILEVAVMREKASYNFYFLLSQKTKIHSAKQVFLYLAQQEQNHLHKLESELLNILS